MLFGLLSAGACDEGDSTGEASGETEGQLEDDDSAENPDVPAEDLEVCEPDASVRADFVVEVDGAVAWPDERVIDLENGWYVPGADDPELDLDLDCEPVSQDDVTATLACTGAGGEMHDIVLSFPSGPPLETLPDAVHFRYVTHDVIAEFGNPDVVGHAFTLENEDGLVAAGILSRSEFSRWGAHAAFTDAVGWEDQPPACAPSFTAETCFGFQPMSVALTLGEQTQILRPGQRATIGGYEVLVARAEATREDPNWPPPESDGDGCAGFEMHHALVVRTP